MSKHWQWLKDTFKPHPGLNDMVVCRMEGVPPWVKFLHESGYIISLASDGSCILIEDPLDGMALQEFRTDGNMLEGIIRANEYLNKFCEEEV